MAAEHSRPDVAALKVYSGLALGIVAVSFAAVLIRLAQSPPAVTAFYRMVFSAGFFLPLAWSNRQGLRRLSGRDFAWMLLGGILLACHFLAWMSSFDFTSVASSVFFVTTQPIFVALVSHLLLQEPSSTMLYVGIVLAGLGTLVIGLGDLAGSETTLYGNGLALLGSVFAAGYFLIGRHVRAAAPLYLYVFIVYGCSAVVLLGYVLARQLPLSGFATSTWTFLLLLAIVPTVIGHTCFNWALRHLPAPAVSVTILGEPVGATLWAYLILQEQPGLHTIFGGSLILAGIYIAVTRQKKA